MAKTIGDLSAAIRYDAQAAWEYGELNEHFRTKITDAVIRDNEISIDWPPVEGAATQTILRRTAGSNYVGRSVWASGTSQEDESTVEAVLYSNQSGHILVGQETWRISGKTDWFVVQFRAPDSLR